MLRVPALATAVILAGVLLYMLVTFAGGARKLSQVEPLPERGSYRVMLDFAPERFHQLVLQEKGRLVEVQGNTVYMVDVTAPALRDIAREYWVASVARWQPP